MFVEKLQFIFNYVSQDAVVDRGVWRVEEYEERMGIDATNLIN